MLDRINRALNGVFLGGRFESRPLYLVLDNEGREQLASSLGIDASEVEEECCRAVSLELEQHGDPYSKFETALWSWVLSGRTTRPPFTALLFVLAHAAEQMVSDGEFSAGNYYDRLSALVNVDPGRLSQHGRSTEQFWKAFNDWLANNDFAYGRPTARAINSYRYVGIAMSQAIVREEDRRRFHGLFEKYGFSNTDDVSESEIEQYVAAWMRSSGPTRQLKEAWKKADLRPRICEATISELEEWQAEHAATGQGEEPSFSRLSLALSIRHDLLGRSAALYFGKEQSLDPVQLCMEEAGQLELSNTTFAAFATLEPRSSIPLAKSLLHGIELERDGYLVYKWAGRPAIPLSRSDQGYWSEVSRVSLGVEHVVLVRDDPGIRGAIEDALEEAAAPGYTLATRDRLKGLPPGWVLYEKVVIKRALSELKGFESVLSPVGETASLRFEGGIKLGRGIYHRWVPPTVVLESPKGGASLTAWEGTSSDGPQLCKAESDSRLVELSLADSIPEQGNVYVLGKSGKKTIASASLLFRSAERPRPLHRQDEAIVRYIGIQRSTVGQDNGSGSVRGLTVPGGEEKQFDLDVLSAFEELPEPRSRCEDEAPPSLARSNEVAKPVRARSQEHFMALPCAVRGRHRLQYAYIPPTAPKSAPVDVKCLDCDITFLHRRKPARTGRSSSSSRRDVPRSNSEGAEIARRQVDHDLWLDGACFIGAGSAAVFETFASFSSVDTWRAGPVIRDLAWLGHIDVETGPTFRPRRWSASPPVLSMTADDTAVLSGFRCNSLTEQVRVAVSESGGELTVTHEAGHPDYLVVSGLCADELRAATAELRDPHGREITIVSRAASQILGFLSGRSPLVDMFRPVSLGTGVPVQRYDVLANRWRNAEAIQPGGAYRVSEAGTSYVFVGASGRAFVGPHEMVKLAAARAQGLHLHAYDGSMRRFTSRLGCEPVGLLGRALVACSGRLPRVRDGATVFENVPPGVAAGVLQYLYDGELPG